MSELAYSTWAQLFARPAFRKVNSLLLHLALRGLGVGNTRSEKLTGEPWFLELLLSRINGQVKAPTIFDVGANEGTYARRLRALAPKAKIYCFEPNPTTCTRLRKVAESLDLEIVEKALGSLTGEATLFDYSDERSASQHASLFRDVIEKQHGGSATGTLVRLTTVDEFCRERCIERIDFLKIDIEGHEYSCLEGARTLLARNAIGAIQFEFNSMNVCSRVTMEQFFEVLNDFTLYRLLPKGLLRLNRIDTLQSNFFGFQNIIALPTKFAADFSRE